jgi:hypothetical protein
MSSPTPQASPTSDLGGLSENESASLRSLQKVNGYPFYVMDYFGTYPYPQEVAILPGDSGFSCSLFAAMGDPSAMVYGRNFDWEYSPALLLFTNPPDGYASVSMVDLAYLDFTSEEANHLTELPIEDRSALLAAPALPFDGMNQYGLTIAMAAVPEEFRDDVSYEPSRPELGGIGIIRQVLDHARNVDEAVAMFGQYNIVFGGGPPMHYLLADPSGKAALVEFYQGEMVVIPNETPWHIATNHLRCISEGSGGCYRYRTLSDQLTATNGQLDPTSAMSLLSDVRQGFTQWSIVYNMSSGDITIATGENYESIYSYHLDIINP